MYSFCNGAAINTAFGEKYDGVSVCVHVHVSGCLCECGHTRIRVCVTSYWVE